MVTKASFDQALRRHKVRKFDNCRLILSALAYGPAEGLLHNEVLAEIRETVPQCGLSHFLASAGRCLGLPVTAAPAG